MKTRESDERRGEAISMGITAQETFQILIRLKLTDDTAKKGD